MMAEAVRLRKAQGRRTLLFVDEIHRFNRAQQDAFLPYVESGDVVLVPYGYHGPAMAVPGYDLYYLNVMAGPGRREWLICEDPAHSWIRENW